jgi:hypothetical protein
MLLHVSGDMAAQEIYKEQPNVWLIRTIFKWLTGRVQQAWVCGRFQSSTALAMRKNKGTCPTPSNAVTAVH